MNAMLQSILDAHSPARMAAIVERATLQPYMVSVDFEDNDGFQHKTFVVEACAARPPVPEDLLEGAGALRILRGEVYPASIFEDMPLPVRAVYILHYSTYLKWKAAKTRRLHPDDLRAWTDFDPIFISEEAQRWVTGGLVRYAGD